VDILIDSNPISPGYEDAVFFNGTLTKEYTTPQFIGMLLEAIFLSIT
jgi:hypothetical protein